jgi:hypothetical protein
MTVTAGKASYRSPAETKKKIAVVTRRLVSCQCGVSGVEGKVLRLESLPDCVESSATRKLGSTAHKMSGDYYTVTQKTVTYRESDLYHKCFPINNINCNHPSIHPMVLQPKSGPGLLTYWRFLNLF